MKDVEGLDVFDLFEDAVCVAGVGLVGADGLGEVSADSADNPGFRGGVVGGVVGVDGVDEGDMGFAEEVFGFERVWCWQVEAFEGGACEGQVVVDEPFARFRVVVLQVALPGELLGHGW